MPGLEDFFAYGYQSKEFKVGEKIIKLGVLDAKHFQDALEASAPAKDETSKFLEFKKQILARAIMSCDGVIYCVAPNKITEEETKKTLALLEQMHVIIINQLYEFYDELDKEVQQNLDNDIKK